jgi:DHA2 family multidrug resistance protein-like MFS transporter
VRPRKGLRSRSLTEAEVASDELLDRGQRRLLLGLCIGLGAATTVPATYNYVLLPMLNGLGASESQGSLLRQLPSIGGLLVIFLAGILGYRWGERRFITMCGFLFAVGNAAVAVAPDLKVAVAGLVLESIGASGFIVVALALLSAKVSNEKARASAFAIYAMATPVVYLTMPLLAGVIVDDSSWRLVAVVWALGGIVMIIASRLYLPAEGNPRESRELLTPALAGVVLTAAVQTVSFADRDGVLSVDALVRLGVALVASVALYLVFRRTASPSLSLAALRQGGLSLMLIIVILVSFAGFLWFYMTVAFQFLYGLSTLQNAMAMLPAQVAALGGAAITRSFMRRRGITVAGTTLLAALAASLLLSALITEDSPMWVAIAVMSVYAIAQVGVGIPITNAVMDHALEGEDGSASAFRSAAGNVGAAVGVVVLSTIVFTTFSGSLTNTLAREGLNSKQSASIAARIRAGASSENVSANYSVPLRHVEQIADAQRAAMADGLRAHGLSGAAFTGVCLVIFYWSRRRQERKGDPDRAPPRTLRT